MARLLEEREAAVREEMAREMDEAMCELRKLRVQVREICALQLGCMRSVHQWLRVQVREICAPLAARAGA